jgi:hypothetical protein
VKPTERRRPLQKYADWMATRPPLERGMTTKERLERLGIEGAAADELILEVRATEERENPDLEAAKAWTPKVEAGPLEDEDRAEIYMRIDELVRERQARAEKHRARIERTTAWLVGEVEAGRVQRRDAEARLRRLCSRLDPETQTPILLVPFAEADLIARVAGFDLTRYRPTPEVDVLEDSFDGKALVDQLCDGDHNDKPGWVQEVLRRLANDLMLPERERQRIARLAIERGDDG